MVEHYRPADRPNHIYVINWKTGTGEWEPLFDDNGDPLYPTLIRELDEIEGQAADRRPDAAPGRHRPLVGRQGRAADSG